MKQQIKALLISAVFAISLPVSADEQSIDLASDDFKVFTFLANEYLSKNIKHKSFVDKREFGTGFTSFNGDSYPKTGFVGYELVDSRGKESLVKLQLFKNDKGWSVVNLLANDKIHEANPTYIHSSDNARSNHQRKAKVAAALELEKFFNQQSIINNVRSTSVSCYAIKDYSKASCHAIYGLKVSNDIVCKSKSFLMAQGKVKWQVAGEINYDQKIDYSTGELKNRKAFTKYCT